MLGDEARLFVALGRELGVGRAVPHAVDVRADLAVAD
jgi:hypothetical protein